MSLPKDGQEWGGVEVNFIHPFTEGLPKEVQTNLSEDGMAPGHEHQTCSPAYQGESYNWLSLAHRAKLRRAWGKAQRGPLPWCRGTGQTKLEHAYGPGGGKMQGE